MTLWPEDSAADYLNGMMTYADKLMARSRELDQALAATSATVQRQELTVTVQDVVVEDLTFTRDVSAMSPITLREKVLSAYHEAEALSLNRQGNAVARTTGDPAIVAETQKQALDAGDLSGRDVRYEAEQPVGGIAVSRADIAGRPDPLDEIPEVESLASLVRELGWHEHHTPGDPSTWQRDLERELDEQARRAEELKPRIEQAQAEATQGAVTVTAGARGDLRDVRFGALRQVSQEQLAKDFRLAYSEASNDAADQVEELLRDSGLSFADDDDDDLLDPFVATYRRVPREPKPSN